VTWAIAGAVLASGCASRYGAGDPLAVSSKSGNVPAAQRAAVAERKLSAADQRVRELENELAARDREIAAVRQEISTAPGISEHDSAADASAGRRGESAAPASPTDTESAARREEAAASLPAPVAPAAQTVPAQVAPAQDAPSQAHAAASGAKDAQLADAQQRIAGLEDRLRVETQRRQEVEAEMTRLLQETSAGPFEHSNATVEKHLQQQLDGARQEIAELRTTLATERRERDDVERKYSALQAQMQRSSNAGGSEEVEALKERQRRVLASIQQDLEASRQREREMRETLEHSQGKDAVSLADAVSGMRSENDALQQRLEEEHRQNRDLQAKLKTATHVTDLIFKMQSGGSVTTGTAAP